ncbi:MAG TPA: hypothetical protein VMU34_27255, partial [Mycobacterium sp.]|nr:hypothetical protein [Mycobacterium sp.]
MVTGFQLLSTGGYVPLLVMALLPVLIGLEVSRRRAVIVLAITVVAFVVSVLQDPVMLDQLSWLETIFLFGLCGFLCATSFVAVYVEQRHANSIAGLSRLRAEFARRYDDRLRGDVAARF